MKMILASALTTILIVAMTLAAMFILVRTTVYVTSLKSPLERAMAIGAELLLGVVLLLGTVWLATHLRNEGTPASRRTAWLRKTPPRLYLRRIRNY